MANFVLLYSCGGMPETDEELSAAIQDQGAWYSELGEALVDGGYPLTPVAVSVPTDRTVNRGPVGTMATGYPIIRAEMLGDTAELTKSYPACLGVGCMTVYETFPVM